MISYPLSLEGKNITYQVQNSVQMNDREEDSLGGMREYSIRENVIKLEKKFCRFIQQKKNILSMTKKYGGVMNGRHEITGKILILIVHFLINTENSQKMSHFHLQQEKISKIANIAFTLQISKIATWWYQILLVKTSSMAINEMDQKIVSIFTNRTTQNIVIKLSM